jgi:PKD repeat protein
MCDAGGPYTGETEQTIQFTGSARYGTPPYTWAWNFGDGATSAEQNPSHTYTAMGSYTITLVVTDSVSETATDSATATIIPKQQELGIGNITGGLLKIKTTIKNLGTSVANNISWNISLVGGFILTGKQTVGSLPSLDPGEEQTIASKPIIGFGKTVVKIIATIPEATASKNQNATVLFFFIKMK